MGEVSYNHDGSNVEDLIILRDQLEILQKIWPQLDERSRYLLEAKYILELIDVEIAADLKLKPKSVRMALTRARKKAFVLARNRK